MFTGYPWKGALEILESMLGLDALTAEGKVGQRLTLSPESCLIICYSTEGKVSKCWFEEVRIEMQGPGEGIK